MASKAKTKIQEAIKVFNAKSATMRNSLLGVGVLLVGIAEIVAELSRNGDETARAELKADAIQAWREYVTPLDIPGVPNLGIEPLLDNLLESAFASTLDAGLKEIADLRAEVTAILKAE